MANLPESPVWEDGIYQLEPTDPVLGGEPPDGVSNIQAQQLANRTSYLKQFRLGLLYSFAVVDGNLILFYQDNMQSPAFYINDDGDLIAEIL